MSFIQTKVNVCGPDQSGLLHVAVSGQREQLLVIGTIFGRRITEALADTPANFHASQ
jgi:hypothetical protein